MGYLLKKDMADIFSRKYKNKYLSDELGISGTYVSLILHRKQRVPKRIALAFTKIINQEANINDYFELAR